MRTLALSLTLLASASLTEAQVGSGIIVSPAQPPILATPIIGGTVAVIRPGQTSFLFTPPQSGSTIVKLGEQPGYYIPFSPASVGSTLAATPYGITLPGYPSVLDRPLAPFGITLPNSPEPSR
jgi:hypothetical protein